jgi:hypothetical protein
MIAQHPQQGRVGINIHGLLRTVDVDCVFAHKNRLIDGCNYVDHARSSPL